MASPLHYTCGNMSQRAGSKMIETQNRSTQKRPTGAIRSSTRMNGVERRRQLIDAATAVFSQKGFSGSTTKEIAGRAKINEATIFRHFESKDALFDAVVADKFTEFNNADLCQELKAAAARNDDAGVFYAAGKLVLERFKSSRDVLRLLIFGILEQRNNVVDRYKSETQPLRDLLKNYIEKRQRDGAMKEQDAEFAVFGFMGMVTHHATTAELICRPAGKAEDESALRTYTKIILDGLTRV